MHKGYGSIKTNANPPKNHTKEPTFREKEVSGKRGKENGPKAEQDKTDRATLAYQGEDRQIIEKTERKEGRKEGRKEEMKNI